MSTIEDRIAARLSHSQKRAFQIAVMAARRVIERRLRLLRLVKTGLKKLAGNETALRRIRDDLYVLLRLAAAWARREYREIPWKSMLYASAALLYFISPIDLIPDPMIAIGFVDDVAVVSAVVSAIHHDLERFIQWELDRERALLR